MIIIHTQELELLLSKYPLMHEQVFGVGPDNFLLSIELQLKHIFDVSPHDPQE